MDVQKKLDEIVAAVGNARSMPMSASCVVNRAELLALLAEVREALPGSLAQARELLGDREGMVADARAEAERIVSAAHQERGSLIADTEVARRSQGEADRILVEARQEAEEIRAEADDYVDSKLANFEVVLTKTLGSVGRGRDKLLGTGPGPALDGHVDPDYAEAPERSHDPETLRRRADEYVDVKLGAFEAVLAKTLEAVGRGRQKLHGRVAADELGLLADGADGPRPTSDADYLADLAAMSDPATGRAVPGGPAPAAPGTPPAAPPLPPAVPVPVVAQTPPPAQDAYGQQDAYGYGQDTYGYPQGYEQQQQGYGYPERYGYGQQDYAAQGGGYETYDAQQQGGGGYGSPGGYGTQPPAPQPTALDETSLFDTAMITPEQLRRYEEGR
ncbi:ATP synthase F0 subunit B [Streptomyces sp. NPDC005955]|uniref:ATP synthase F0 subunit B n=1 Tax=Streptomyces sp. NPDC005955 TaxID=3364738 RepID=UPI00368DE7EC